MQGRSIISRNGATARRFWFVKKLILWKISVAPLREIIYFPNFNIASSASKCALKAVFPAAVAA